MLRRFAAVARVPREEDFGIDAICTLLRRDEKLLFAENTFAVQVKAESGVPIEMNEEACSWLRRLDVPMFLLSVDLKNAIATLFSYEGAVERPEDLAAHPGNRQVHTVIPAGRRAGLAMLSSMISDAAGGLDHRLRWLGSPIATFALHDLTIEEEIRQLQALLKSWCLLVMKRIYFRRFGIEFELIWETDEAPRHGGLMISTNPAELTGVLEEMLPLLLKAETALHSIGREDLNDEFTAIKRCADEFGVWVPGFSLRAP